ncbi:hypothetical protein GY45DRAFT_911238 [Cubamyces sp. BRFM 1775]|nr:hypothetical protein GY45DRAFT_911238 [Cubamyces sp. BRFM 1775]
MSMSEMTVAVQTESGYIPRSKELIMRSSRSFAELASRDGLVYRCTALAPSYATGGVPPLPHTYKLRVQIGARYPDEPGVSGYPAGYGSSHMPSFGTTSHPAADSGGIMDIQREAVPCLSQARIGVRVPARPGS